MIPSEFIRSQRAQLTRTPSGHWAFVPSPLPPALQLGLPTIRRLSEADRAVGLLAGLAPHLPNVRSFIRPLLRREAVLSSRIEGTQTELSQLVLFEAARGAGGAVHGRSMPADVREVANYGIALDHGLRRLRTLPISLRWIRELHERLLRGVRGSRQTPGEFRRHQNFIGPEGAGIQEATYVPPPVLQLMEGLDAFEGFLHAPSDLPPLVRQALIHYQFEALHPFGDGNGRVGRLLTILLMVQEGLLPAPLLYLSAFYEDRRSEYYERLKAVSTHRDWEGWFMFFLEGVAQQALDAVERASNLRTLRDGYIRRGLGARPSAVLLRLTDLFLERVALTTGEAARSLNVTYRAAAQNVAKLVQAGIVEEVTGRSRNRIYVAQRVLDILEA